MGRRHAWDRRWGANRTPGTELGVSVQTELFYLFFR